MEVVSSSKFKKQLKRYRNAPKVLLRVREFIKNLAKEDPITASFLDHKLKGKLHCCREFHIFPDVLIIYFYSKEEDCIILREIGSHSELFK